MISGYLCRFCKPKTNSVRGWNPDCATSALESLAGSFSCSVPFAVWHFCGRGAACSSNFCSALREKLVAPGKKNGADFSTKFQKGHIIIPEICLLKKKKKKKKNMFVFPENYSCIYRIPPQKQNYAKNCKMSKRAHIFQFSLEILQKPFKLLIKNDGNQSRHLLEKLTELNKAFHFWLNNGLEKCFQAT